MPVFRFSSEDGVVKDGAADTIDQSITSLNASVATLTAAVSSVTYTVAGAIAPTGAAVLKTGAASAMTLVAPPDGANLLIYAADAKAYVVTTPADAVGGNTDTMTFGGAAGDHIQLTSSAGVWLVVANVNVTLSEA